MGRRQILRRNRSDSVYVYTAGVCMLCIHNMIRALQELSLRKIRELLERTHEDPLREVSALQYLSCEWHPNVLECTEVTLRWGYSYLWV